MAENKITIPVTGMTCANCAMNIERTLNKREWSGNGVKSTFDPCY